MTGFVRRLRSNAAGSLINVSSPQKLWPLVFQLMMRMGNQQVGKSVLTGKCSDFSWELMDKGMGLRMKYVCLER